MLSASRASWRTLTAIVGATSASPSSLQDDRGERGAPELVGQRAERTAKVAFVEELGAQPEDEAAQVADRPVDRVDRALDACLRLRRVFLDELAHVLEREANGVEALDHAVVQVLADSLAFGHHGHPLELGIQPGVADGDPRVPRERLHDAHVVVGEVLAAVLLGEIEVPDRAALDANGRPEERVHRRMCLREAGATVVGHHVVDADRAVLLDQQSEQAMAARQRSDREPRLIGHPAGDELLDHAVVAERAERGVLGADQRSDEIDDQLEKSLELWLRGEGDGRGLEGFQPRRERRDVHVSRAARRPDSSVHRS